MRTAGDSLSALLLAKTVLMLSTQQWRVNSYREEVAFFSPEKPLNNAKNTLLLHEGNLEIREVYYLQNSRKFFVIICFYQFFGQLNISSGQTRYLFKQCNKPAPDSMQKPFSMGKFSRLIRSLLHEG